MRALTRILHRVAVAALLAGGALGISACGDDPGSGGVRESGVDRPAQRMDGSPNLRARVVRVIDGDTLDARLAGGRTVRVRLLGIDTPEKTDLRAGRAECGGQRATEAAQALARRWPDVLLRADPSQDAEDRYGRMLAYVDVDGEAARSYQLELLTQGWAKVYVLARRPIARVDAFRRAAAEARRARRGVWASCDGDFRRPLPG